MIKVSIRRSGLTGCFCPRASEYRNNVSIDWGKSKDEIIEQKFLMKGKKLCLENRTLTAKDWGFTFYNNISRRYQE